jgi:hypothetical protein
MKKRIVMLLTVSLALGSGLSSNIPFAAASAPRVACIGDPTQPDDYGDPDEPDPTMARGEPDEPSAPDRSAWGDPTEPSEGMINGDPTQPGDGTSGRFLPWIGRMAWVIFHVSI